MKREHLQGYLLRKQISQSGTFHYHELLLSLNLQETVNRRNHDCCLCDSASSNRLTQRECHKGLGIIME